MLLEDIDFGRLTDVTDANRWGIGTSRDRKMFRSPTHFYKIWGPEFLKSTMAAVGDEFVKVSGLRRLHGFEVGLFHPEISAAFIEDIVDKDGILRGYVTLVGTHPKILPDKFVEDVFNACVTCGWVFSDLKIGNVLQIGDRLSIIDFDTHLCSLAQLDVTFETESGCLRPHIPMRFRSLIRSHVSGGPNV